MRLPFQSRSPNMNIEAVGQRRDIIISGTYARPIFLVYNLIRMVTEEAVTT